MMTTRMIWTLVVMLVVPIAGCAPSQQHVASRPITAVQPATSGSLSTGAQPPIAGQHGSPEEFRLTAHHAPAESIANGQRPDSAVGNRYMAPPATPAAPRDLQSDQSIALHGVPLTLAALESLACQHNPTLLQAQRQIDGELGKAVQAGRWPNPTLSYVQEQIGVGGTPGEFVGGSLSQRFVTGHKLELSRSKYLARTQAAEWHALEQQYRVLNDVRLHYFRARGQHDLIQIHRELLKSAEDNVLTQRERYNVGQATRADVHLANVALQRVRLDLLRRENDFRKSFEILTALAGVDLPPAPLHTPLDGDMTPINYRAALDRLLVQSPQLQAARSKLESDRLTIERERVEPLPDVVVEAGAGYNFEAQETVGSARASIELPIFDRNQGTIRQAEADYFRQQGELRRLELMLKQDLARVYGDYLTALQHATNYSEVILPEARSAYELQLRSYRDNRIAWNDVLRTQEQYFQLRAEYVQHLIAWREAEVLIHGFLLHGGLMAPTAPPPPGHINAVPKPR